MLEATREKLDQGVPVLEQELDEAGRGALDSLFLLTAKPSLFIANVDEAGFSSGGDALRSLEEYAQGKGAAVIPVCVALESEISRLDSEGREEFLADLGLSASGLERVVGAAYRLLGCMTYFTAGPKEARAWTIRRGMHAPEVAGVIHTDFEKGFICAEVIAYEDYIACNGETGAREAGKCRTEGRGYEVQEADVVHFRFNV